MPRRLAGDDRETQEGSTHPTDYVVIVRKMRLALFAAKYLVGVEIDVVRQPHAFGLHGGPEVLRVPSPRFCRPRSGRTRPRRTL